jgi:hypothetical protein
LSGNEVFENLTVLPRYFLVWQNQTPPPGLERQIQSGQADLRRIAYSDAPPEGGPSAIDSPPGGVRTISYEPDALELETTAGVNCFLVLSEAYYPGWRATLDGKPSEIFRTDIAFRGMRIPRGQHRIRMEFHPPIFDLARGVSAVTLALIAAMVFFRDRMIFRDRDA